MGSRRVQQFKEGAWDEIKKGYWSPWKSSLEFQDIIQGIESKNTLLVYMVHLNQVEDTL